MKFELNKRYKLRGGGWGMPVRVLRNNADLFNLRLAVVLDALEGDGEVLGCYTLDGREYSNAETAYDLLPIPYEDPQQPKKLYAFTDEAFAVHFLTDTNVVEIYYNDCPIRLKRAPEYDLHFPVSTSRVSEEEA